VAKIVMYTTQWCGYCNAARQLLTRKGQHWDEIDVESEAGRREEMIQRSGRRTVPQIWIGERHVGGFDDLSALERKGELDALLAAS
jgi:glutaredoxin 3